MEENQELQILDKKKITKRVSHVFKWMLLYNILLMVLAGILTSLGVADGLESLAATLIGVMLMYVCTRKKWPVQPFRKGERKMTGKDFFLLFCLLMIVQLLTTGIIGLLDASGVQGTAIDISYSSVVFFLYVAFTGPLCEELVYRGFACGKLREIGKIPAIVLSALAFGLMHANAAQFIVGTLSGLLFGFIFIEYSLWWTILLHVINNFLISALPTVLFEGRVEDATFNIIYYSIIGVFAVIGIVMLIKRRGEAAAYLKDPANHAAKGTWGAALKSGWFWIFVLLYLALIVLMMAFPEQFSSMAASAVNQTAPEAAAWLLG